MPLNVAMALSGLEPNEWPRTMKDLMDQVPPPLVDEPQLPHQVFLMASYNPNYNPSRSVSNTSSGSSSPLDSPPYEESCSSSGFSSLMSLDSCRSFFSNESASTKALLSSYGALSCLSGASSASSHHQRYHRSESCSETSSSCISPVHSASGDTTTFVTTARPQTQPIRPPPKVTYQGRDLLDLNGNLSDAKWTFQYSKIKDGLESYWANRSVISRLGNQYPPMPRMVRCMAAYDCNFQLPQFE